jgi:hypothetical protein
MHPARTAGMRGRVQASARSVAQFQGSRLANLLGRVIGDAGEDVVEPGAGIDVVELAGFDECEHGGDAVAPQKVQLRRPTAMPRMARSAALLLMQRRPLSRKRVNARHRFRL